jgi:hypothetical protein
VLVQLLEFSKNLKHECENKELFESWCFSNIASLAYQLAILDEPLIDDGIC